MKIGTKTLWARYGGLLALCIGLQQAAMAADVDVISTQTSLNATYGLPTLSGDTTWTSDNTYILTDRLYVPDGVTLTIDPGTRIYSTFDDKGTATAEDDSVGAVIVCRGGKLNAVGNAAEPIIFDALQSLEVERGMDLSYDPDSDIGPAPTVETGGLWGGIVMLGNAYIAVTDGSGVNIGNKIIEGFVPTGFVDADMDTRPDVLEYGFDTLHARDDADDSGSLAYISIRHGGYTFGTDNEINGLTLAGVGTGTSISYVEVVANQDDGVEFFGGTVNTDHLIVAFGQDDGFDIDEGHSGTHQFWFAIQNPNGGDNLGEWDGVGGASKGSTDASITRSNPKIYNATFVGPGSTSFTNDNVAKDNGIFMDDYFNGQVRNSLFTDSVNFLTSFASDGDGEGIVFEYNTVGNLGRSDGSTDSSVITGAPSGFYVNGFGMAADNNSAAGTDPGFNAYERDGSGFLTTIDPRPVAPDTSVAAGAPEVADFRGAFDGTTNWAAGWTFLEEGGYFGNDSGDVDVIASQTLFNATYGLPTLSGDTTWTSDKTYILTDRLYVPDGVTLTIDPGTKVYSTFDDKETATAEDDSVGAVIVCRGGKLNAVGNAAEPIIFDALQNLEIERGMDLSYDPDSVMGPAPTVETGGLWGGIVMLGNAYIAVTDGSGVNIGNKIIEGFVPTGFVDADMDTRPDVLEYGFDTLFARDDADDSGSLAYISIRHGGYTFGTDNEINGLTLAGVGTGTSISYVEVVANQDDGVEFFGGTVNTDHLIVAFGQDDGFDIDEGHSGTHQFWFAVQNPNGGDNLGEWDGVGGASKGSTDASITRSNPKIYNATFVGAGPMAFGNENVAKDNGIFMDDYFNGQVRNSLFTDSVNFLTSFASDGDGEGIVFENNTVGNFGRWDGSTDSSVITSAPTGYYVNGFGAADNGNTTAGTSPGFSAYERDGTSFLTTIDPRPTAGSSALTDAVSAGAPTTANFRGAFDGATNWAAGWTFLEEGGYFATGGADYDTYAAGFTPPLGAPTEDDDKDGLNNDFERLFGLDPQSAGSSNPIVVPFDAAAKTFSYTRRDTALTGVSYEIWTSSDLTNWTRDTGAAQTPTLNGEVETVAVTLSAMPVDGKLFFQIRSN